MKYIRTKLDMKKLKNEYEDFFNKLMGDNNGQN